MRGYREEDRAQIARSAEGQIEDGNGLEWKRARTKVTRLRVGGVEMACFGKVENTSWSIEWNVLTADWSDWWQLRNTSKYCKTKTMANAEIIPSANRKEAGRQTAKKEKR